MQRDKFFKAAFLLTFVVALITFATNIEIDRPRSEYFDAGERMSFEHIDEEEITRLIEEGKLSDREALFYRVLEY